MKTKKQILRLLVDEGVTEKVREIAFDMGYRAERGASARRVGSISALIIAIANGDVQLVHTQRPTDNNNS